MSESITGKMAVESHPQFFEVSERGDELVVNFLACTSGTATGGGRPSATRVHILPSAYEDFRALADRLRGRAVVVTGRGPVEGYFAIGYYAALFGASRISYEGPNGKNFATMPMAGTPPAEKPWLSAETTDTGNLVTITKSPSSDGKWRDDEIGWNAPALLPKTAANLTFTGLGAVSMYLLLGVSAAYAGLADVRIDKPTEPFATRFTSTRAGEVIAVSGKKRGVVVGIIGDPNSGKSVFSRAFYMALRDSMPRWFKSWIYDCDLASPTPDWYCSALVTADSRVEAEYKAIRNEQKVPWSPALEKRCADDLNVLRTKLDMVIADLPGGRHKDDDGNPLEHPVRVGSASRAEMLRACDAFILICRKDRHDFIERGWFDALAEYGLENRVVAILDSDKPDGEFSVTPVTRDGDGFLRGEICGLKREHPAGETGRRLAAPVRPLVRALAAIPVVNAARAATATAFLAGDKGTRYGAAVRSAATGRIFAAGQYSSFNHSTNIHAEMNALSQAATAGEPDVDVLAIASTSPAETSPCGVCRQVILEHAIRTGRDFDVALTTPGRPPAIMPVSQLLPHAWRAPSPTAADDLRSCPFAEKVFCEDSPPTVGSEFLAPPHRHGDPLRMAMVWDAAFSRDTALCKYKYERTMDGLWRKMPHAFADSAAYLRYLADNRCGSETFNGLATFRMPVPRTSNGSPLVSFRHPVRLPPEEARVFADALFEPAGIDVASAVSVTGSRMTGIASGPSDWDICVAATPEQIAALRARVVALAAEGRVTFPDKSRSWKLVKSLFPGAAADGGARLLAECRYADSFCLDGIPISFLFVPPGDSAGAFAFPKSFVAAGRAAIAGRVISARHAPYKRSESIVETSDRRNVRLLCYHKLANLLKAGDRIAATGVLCRHESGDDVLCCGETLVLSAAAIDRLVWQP